jgi:hypothetical protein
VPQEFSLSQLYLRHQIISMNLSALFMFMVAFFLRLQGISYALPYVNHPDAPNFRALANDWRDVTRLSLADGAMALLLGEISVP